MQLGERIYLLRTSNNLSQGDLAEKLDVSRQSISKWENNNAVPDLEKLLKLSEVFGISLDELVKGEAPAPEPVSSPPLQPAKSGHKTAGVILFGFAAFVVLLLTIMGSFAAGLLFASPLIVCGTICMVCKRNAGLWCAWAAVLMVDLYLRYGTGLNWSTVFLTFRWTYQMNYMRLAISWVQFLVILVLVCATAVRLRAQREADKKRLIARWGIVLLITLVLWVLGQALIAVIENAGGDLSALDSMYSVYNTAQNLLDWGRIMAFAAALTETLRHLKQKKA
ncbi:MAG: helix-turn-helix transcriptional regulator [Butyricicoccus sp.]|nr:helix-turn-helix transcriptional regulator [Butyricicoccus sp.]